MAFLAGYFSVCVEARQHGYNIPNDCNLDVIYIYIYTYVYIYIERARSIE